MLNVADGAVMALGYLGVVSSFFFLIDMSLSLALGRAKQETVTIKWKYQTVVLFFILHVLKNNILDKWFPYIDS